MGFDGRFEIRSEGRSHSNICDALSPFAVRKRDRRIDPEFWNHPIMRMKICGWETNSMAATIAAYDYAFDTVRSPEHTPREVDTAFCEQFTDLRRTHTMAAQPDFGNFVCYKAEVRAHFFKQFDIAAAMLAKSEAFSKINFLSMQTVVDDRIQEIFSMLGREFAIELNDHRLFDPKLLEICEPLI